MATRTHGPLLAATMLATIWAFPGIVLAQDATPGGAPGPTTLPTAAEMTAGPSCVRIQDGSGCLAVAPSGDRVDLAAPLFSAPTKITNPLFPISDLHSVLMLGHVDGKPFRTEVTLLPETKAIDWNGARIETLVSQYTAYLDGRIQEVAIDHYAQSDDGSVWYFGEDVSDYDAGVVTTNEGTWRAGLDGPAAMIMPADPRVGDVYRTETIPGIAFEEVTVERVGQTVNGPHGPVGGAIVVSELHQDGTTEDKTFAPGYGEFRTGGGGDLEALALAVPTDALPGPAPAELETLRIGATDVLDAAESEDWSAASTTVTAMTAAWEAYRTGAPALIGARMGDALVALAGAVDAHSPAEAQQAAIDVAQSDLDLQLRYRPPTEIDLVRLELWARQLLVDAAADDADAVKGDVVTLELIRDRVANAGDPSTAKQIDADLAALRAAADGDDLSAATDAAARLRDLLTAGTNSLRDDLAVANE